MSASQFTTKTCNVCQREFPATPEFWHKRKASKDGLCMTCKECAKARSKQWLDQNPDRAKEQYRQYYQIHQDGIKARVRQYAKDNAEQIKKSKAKRYQSDLEQEREKRRIYSRLHNSEGRERFQRWVEKHPNRRREIANKYGKTHKGAAARLRRRAREREVPAMFTDRDWSKCLAWWHDTCAYCGKQKALTADHFIPLASADCPGTVPENILPSCKSCNSSKQDRDPVEWLSSRVNDNEYAEILARVTAYFDII